MGEMVFIACAKVVFRFLRLLGDLIHQIETRTKELKNIKQNRISDSIKICIEKIGNDAYRKMLIWAKSFQVKSVT
ncbi:hypothetical protein BpHYR1_005557 [Brachionus plicatilis]|uniref:Uncharacterized protein n=1 Tax=Brachionus plicatilis TaxID=10195 RepID=A0A3M7PP50_BRAPC|nr:hypothetical protein BpHYR1_005557 [Brachionus plicatilis]